eukprot:2525665-Amphidinium_carterae.1
MRILLSVGKRERNGFGGSQSTSEPLRYKPNSLGTCRGRVCQEWHPCHAHSQWQSVRQSLRRIKHRTEFSPRVGVDDDTGRSMMLSLYRWFRRVSLSIGTQTMNAGNPDEKSK